MSQSLAAFALRRTAGAVAVCVAVSALTFLTLHGLAPEFFNDTRPLPLEMLHYLERAFLHADLGVSTFRPFQPVLSMLGESIPADLSMLVGSMAVGLLAGSVGGVLCVRHPGSLLSRLLQVAAAVLLCAPVYVTGIAEDPVLSGHLIRPSEVDDVGSQEGRGRGVGEQQREVARQRAERSPGGRAGRRGASTAILVG